MIILPEQEQGDGNETWSLEANWLKVYLLDDLVFCEDNSNVIAFVFCVLTEHKKPTWSTWRKGQPKCELFRHVFELIMATSVGV